MQSAERFENERVAAFGIQQEFSSGSAQLQVFSVWPLLLQAAAAAVTLKAPVFHSYSLSAFEHGYTCI